MLQNFIGLKVEVLSSPNKSLVKKRGTIIDETLNTIVLELQEKKQKQRTKKIRISKKGLVLKDQDGVILNLSEAIFRPEDRTKKLYKSWLIAWQK